MTTSLTHLQHDLKSIRDGRFDEASPRQRDRAVRELIHTSCAAASVVALQPVPFLDTALLVPLHVGMVQGIARIRGYRLDKRSTFEILRTMRASLLTQHAMMAAAKFAPYVGWIVTVSVADALTYAIGALMDRYFVRGRSMLPAEMRDVLNRLYKEKFEHAYRGRRSELKMKLGRAPSMRRALCELDEARREGRIDDDERDRRKEEILFRG